MSKAHPPELKKYGFSVTSIFIIVFIHSCLSHSILGTWTRECLVSIKFL